MRLGQAAMEALRAEITGCLKPGDELVVACPVALKGTSVIAKNKKAYLHLPIDNYIYSCYLICKR